MPFNGDFTRLQATIRGLRALSKVPAQVSRAAAKEIRAEIQKSFDSRRDPYQQPWQPHAPETIRRWGRHPLLRLTGAGEASIRVYPKSGAGIAVSVESDGLIFAQSGTVAEPRRRWLPDDQMPRTWRLALERATKKSIKEALRAAR